MFLAAFAWAYEPTVILKKNAVSVSKDKIYLSDVADFDGMSRDQADTLSTIYIKRAALPGYSVRVTRENVENQVKKEFRYIKITGPETVTVYTEKAIVKRSDLEKAAESYVLANMPWKQGQAEIKPAAGRGDIEVMSGSVSLKVREGNKLSFKGNVVVPVEIIIDGRFYRIEPVSLLVKVNSDCLVSERVIKAGETLDGKVRIETKDITYMPGRIVPGIEAAAGKTAKRAIMPGTIITAEMLESPPFFRRNSPVVVAVKMRGITVETTGTAMAEGREDSIVKVKLENGKIIEGRVSADGKVIIER